MTMILYFIIAITATTAGAVTGMGGGVIIKPVLDMMGDFDALSISMLSCITVFSMTSVSFLSRQKEGVQPGVVIPLACGSVLGGWLGSVAMDALLLYFSDGILTFLQNIILAGLIVCVFLYMRNKDAYPKLGLTAKPVCIFAGLLLGFFSSFLGIGGGPINVAAFVFLFDYGTKVAVSCSLVTIWFSQFTKIITALIDGTLMLCDLSLLPPMIVGAIAGGFLGRKLRTGFSEKTVDKAFNCMQLLILSLCIWNMVKLAVAFI